MIYTCTLNPSVDYRIELDSFQIGELHRAKQNDYYPGGKGINVSRVLKNFGTPNIAIGFLGGFTGKFILDSLNREGIVSDFVFHEAPTRINVKLKMMETETEINGQGPSVPRECQEMLLKKVREFTSEDYFVISGSLPSGIGFDYYEKMVSIASSKGVSWILDISSPDLKKLLQFKPFLVKPNLEELSAILGRDMGSIKALVGGGKELLQWGAENVIISMGGQGAIFMNADVVLIANAPQGRVKSTVGAGDSMVAGFLSSYIASHDPVSSFAYSVAAGSATAFSDDLCRKHEADRLLPYIKVQTWKEEE